MGLPVAAQQDRLIADIEAHLASEQPLVLRAYPRGHLCSLIDHSLHIARSRFGLSDLGHLKLFVDLRWRISSGYFTHPDIAAVLSSKSMTDRQKFDRLATPAFDDIWDAAEALDGSAYWLAEAGTQVTDG
ncbi:hypothetical protein Z945_2436 [Sulfitobacter noctilucae]|uniref:hypothetical protein n=1 Tax=Sulfitobacter noctilucae TaxID=1342302 RepID=UPI000468C2E9|nr:hypothetical protein [Sulfitobacter noctilucae]KIN61444.1 hypothetical protein Z945_2436 [Sulfitobacter noctilucae]